MKHYSIRRHLLHLSLAFNSLIGIALLFGSSYCATAATFNIADGDVAGLKNAITVANSNQQDDTINLATNGTYTLTAVDNTDAGATGLPRILEDLVGQTTHSLTINGNGATITRSGSAPDFRIFAIYQPHGGSVTLNNLTISNGRTTATGSEGGAIYAWHLLILQNCILTGNSAARDGGAIYNPVGTVSMANCMVSNNTASEGGGISTQSSATLQMSGCTVNNNIATAMAFNSQGGGGIYASGTLTLTNCTLTGNQTAQNGGAINAGGSNVSLTACTVTNNSAQFAGDGILLAGASSLTVGNTILSGLSVSSPATVTSQGYNLSNDNAGGYLTGPGDQINTNPMLDPNGLQNNGGPTQTIALINGSPAIDKGKSFGLMTDQRGQSRPLDFASIPNANGGDGSDIGAFEANDSPQIGPTFVVNTADDHDDGVCGALDCTLREAINAANAASGVNTITFAPAVTGSIILSLGTLNVTDSTTIIGPGARVLTVNGNATYRIFYFSTGTSTISGLTISNGATVGPSTQAVTGAGAIFNQGTLTVNDCTVSNNQALGSNYNGPGGGSGGTMEGGAIANSGVLTLNRCTLNGNGVAGGRGGDNFGNFAHAGNGGAGEGGAIFNYPAGTLLINYCTFNGNSAIGGAGGNGYFGGNGGNGSGASVFNLGAMSVTGATVSGNTGNGGAGGAPSGGSPGLAGSGSGGLTAGGGSSVVGDTISAGNSGNNGGGKDVNGTFSSNGYNLIGSGDHSTGLTNGTNHDQVGTDAASINAQLGTLQNNGGPTNTMALLSNSPAINAGDPNASIQDQRYYLRNGAPDIGAFEFGGTLAPAGSLSSKTHGSAGAFGITFPLSGPIGIECRSGGATNDHQLVLTFSTPVTVNGNPQAQVSTGTGQVGSGGVSNGGAVSINGAVVTVPLTNVANQQRIVVTLASVSDGINTNNVAIPMGVLLGDVNGSGPVDSGDVFLVRQQTGQSATASNFQKDVNASGLIDSGDVFLTRQHTGTSLP
jgi:CSLREA domain-containing protein